MNNVELLAPAGDLDSFNAAINCGANAIYLGMQNFNARDKAENFNLNNLKECVNLAHIHNVKVYLTVNTLINNDEIEGFIDLCNEAILCGIDAFIVQDLGMAYLLKNTFKGIVLHASTQMGIHNLEGAMVAKQLGFSRIVLSRETTLEDIKLIHDNCDIELEYFVQGALCVAFSGNCYLSSIIKGESGNRGRCLQLCRLPYFASTKNNTYSGYFLSPSDLCFIDKLKELIDAGICSFKIEGRLRRSSYVAGAVQSYRRALDNALVGSEKQTLQKLFSRGQFNDGYYLDNNISEKIINPLLNNHSGVKIGEILKVEKFKDIYKIKIKTHGHKIISGDGLKFISQNQQSSMGVGNVNDLGNNVYEVYSKNKPISNNVYLILDKKLEDELLYVRKKIPINAKFVAKTNQCAVLKIRYLDNEIDVSSPSKISEAKTIAISCQQIIDNLNKTNDTPFVFKNVDIEIDNVFIPLSTINDMRRRGITKLTERLLENYAVNKPKIECDLTFYKSNKNIKHYLTHEKYAITSNKTQIPENYDIILSPQNYDIDTIRELIKYYDKRNIFLNLPIIKRSLDNLVIQKILSEFDKTKIGLFINNIYGLHYLNQGYKIITSHNLNLTNNFSFKLMKDMGVYDCEQSIEVSWNKEINQGLSSSYPIALMTFTHCPYKTIYKNNDCKNCKFSNDLIFTSQSKDNFKIRRLKLANCYFELISNNINTDKSKDIVLFD